MKLGWMRCTTAAIALACGLAWSVDAMAQAVPPAQGYSVETQDLTDALTSLGRQARRNVVFDPAITSGKRAPKIDRARSFEDALRQLLNGTGLRFESTPDGSVMVLRQEAAAVKVAPPLPVRIARAADETPPEELTVTGSRIRGAPIAAPVISQNLKQIQDAGQVSLADVFRTLPQNFGGGQNPSIQATVPTASGTNVSSASTINLRGLGPDATLTLLNGHRLVYNASRQGVDISTIPLAALDRVEIVADGASALYGSDAVGGVANIILKRDFDGVTTSARIGTTTDGGGTQTQGNIVAGTVWTTGGVMVVGDMERDTQIISDDRDFATRKGILLMPQLQRISTLVSGHQELTSSLTFEMDALYNKRWSSQFYPTSAAGNYLNTGNRIVSKSESLALAPTLKLALGGDWRMSLTGMYGQDHSAFFANQYANGQLAARTLDCYCNSAWSSELNADGSLVALPAGDAKLAVGGGYRSNTLIRKSPSAPIDVSQRSYYGYGELNLPLLGEKQGIPFVQQLNLSAALRYEEYPGLDSVATPKIGVIWSPTSELDLRGSWGKSFKASTLYQQNQIRQVGILPVTSVGGTGYPATAIALLSLGGNPDLKPERATTWNFSAVMRPRFASGLRLEASYFRIDFKDRVVTPMTSTSTALSNPAYADFITLNPTPAQVTAAYNNAFSVVNQVGVYNPAAVVALVNDANSNAAIQEIRGFDLAASYEIDLRDAGSLSLYGNASYVRSKQQLNAKSPPLTLAGLLFNPPHFRGRAGAVWERDALTFSSYVNYVGGVNDTRTTQVVRVGGMTTLDLTARYRIEEGWLRGSDATLTVQNLFNDKPSVVAPSYPFDATFDSTNYSPVGRFIGLTVSKKW